MTKDEALKLALEALHKGKVACEWGQAHDHVQLIVQAMEAIKEVLAQKDSEPVAFYVYKPTLPRGSLGNVSDGDLPWVYDQDPSSGYSARMLVYITPPQRTWVGLTEDEAFACQRRDYFETYKAIEAKLKEKNT